MFFGKKEKQELSDVTEQLRHISEQLTDYGKTLEGLVKSSGVHDVVIEDLSDSLADLKDQEAETVNALSNELTELRDSRAEESSGREEKLLWLVMEYHNQMSHIGALLSEDDKWNQQLGMIEAILQQKCVEAGVALIGHVGEPVNFSLHEVIDVRETDDPHYDKCIAQVYETGFMYQGSIRKARVAVYRNSPMTGK
ncbi:MAG: nucleotide exchange factor GrpE [Lachnospiraceae bacterium]|nr:nucleotide exchange factor GrpE [Lachnospiraceae bacterium]